MSVDFELNISLREDKGKGASRRLRRLDNQVPAVVYGGKEAAQSIMMSHDDLFHASEKPGFYASIITLKFGKKTQKAIIKDMQRHPFKPKILHADFQRVSDKQTITVAVPIEWVGESSGVKEGGVFTPAITEIEVTCLPADIPESISVDISHLEAGQALQLSEVTPIEKAPFTALMADDVPEVLVASVQAAKVAQEDTEDQAVSNEADGNSDSSEQTNEDKS